MSRKVNTMKSVLSEGAVAEHISQGRQWRLHLGILLPILLMYLLLAFYAIDRQSLWLDEILSIRDAASTASIWKKAHGPLYFALLHVWMQVGTSELALRTLSVLLGAVAVCLFYATSATLFSRRVTILGTMLFATSPFLIWYSQEVRYITLMLATALLTMYTFRQLLARGRPGWWLAYGSAMILAVAAFVTNILLPLVQGLYLLWSPAHRPLLRKWLVCQVLIGMLFFLGSGGKFLRRMMVTTTVNGQQTTFVEPKRLASGTPKEFTPAVIPYTFFTLSAGFSQGPSIYELHLSRSVAALLPHTPTFVSLGLLFGGLFLVGLLVIWRYPDMGKFLTLWVGLPVLGVLGISALTNFAYNVRYVAMVLPAYMLVLAAGITWFRRPVVQVILLGAILVSNGLALANYYFNPYYAREDARATAQYLESVIQPRDIILVVGSSTALRYYAQGKLPLVSLGKLRKTDQPAERLWELTKDYDRLWLVEIRPWAKYPAGKVKAALDKMHGLTEHKQLPGVNIYAYQFLPLRHRQ
jgi:mannosyltransferase